MAYHIDQPQPWSHLPCNPQAPLWDANQGTLYPHPQLSMQSQMQQSQASTMQAPMQPSQVNLSSQRWFQSGPNGPGFYFTQQGLDPQSDGDWHVPRNPPPQMLTPPAESRFLMNGVRPDPWMGAETNNYSNFQSISRATTPPERNLEKTSEPWKETVNNPSGSRQNSDSQSIASQNSDSQNTASQNTRGTANQNSTERNGDDNENDVPQSGENQNVDADNLSTASTAVEESIGLRDMITALQEEMKQVHEASAKQAEEFASLKVTIADSQRNVDRLALDIKSWTTTMNMFASDFSEFIEEWNSTCDPLDLEENESEEEHSHSCRKKSAADAESERDKRRIRRVARQRELSAKGRKKW
ncbi:hypothetical protein BDZ45DRAFT_811643 [Acephala macrosclerotiorum]|nr:hypothetical protein BDZ45DRAFT_811643 [Acephala macrosclerotiorum]